LNRPAPTILNNIEPNDLETHLLECYLFDDDYLQSNPKVAGWRRSNNDDPDFADAEVIVIALMQGRPVCGALPNRHAQTHLSARYRQH
jgi:hypothetical protein